MNYPNFREEKKLYRKGYKIIIGVDEAGRGSLAGPVVACALYFISPSKAEVGPRPYWEIIKDSKQLSQKQRERIYSLLKEDSSVEWGIGRVYQRTIDKINIFEASKLAMRRAVVNLQKKCPNIDFLIIDGNFKINSKISQEPIIKGDEKVFSVAAASIVAKVVRDRMMVNYCKRYPDYCFDKHKGYPTKLHRNLIKRYGICCLHRRTFKVKVEKP